MELKESGPELLSCLSLSSHHESVREGWCHLDINDLPRCIEDLGLCGAEVMPRKHKSSTSSVCLCLLSSH